MQENINIPDSTITSALTFRNLVLMNIQQLTNFPYIEKDFDALTDYELLCLVVKFLNDVIANQNEQNASITRMYQSFLALQTYVNNTKDTLEDAFNELDDYVRNYFENLDVQEEINNKLDQMLDDGVLEQIIEQFIQSTAIWCFDTVADMKQATNLINGSYAKTLGYHSINDGGKSLYKITNQQPESQYYETLDNNLYAILIDEKVHPEQFGAYGDGIHNDSQAIQTALNTGKVVEFYKKTYLCFSLQTNNSINIKGNGATLKRPQLNIEPYNMSVNEMKWIRTIDLTEDSTIDNLIFDNNCFTMWDVSDGYSQEQSCSILARGGSKIINIDITNCKFKNSAGDGLHLVENIKANVSNCMSEDCFRGGLTITGYGSDINVDGWNSKVITAGVNDGFDVEVDSQSSLNPELFSLNISNVVLDYDLDIIIPAKGIGNLNNIIMRSFDETNQSGFDLGAVNNGILNISNSLLRSGKTPTVQTYINGGEVNYINCHIIGNNSDPAFRIHQYQPASLQYPGKLNINNCKIDCFNFMSVAVIKGYININDCEINCSGECFVNNGASSPAIQYLYLKNNNITFSGRLLIVTTSGAIDSIVNTYLYGNTFKGAGEDKITIWGSPNIYYDSTPFEGAKVLQLGGGSTPSFYGNERVIIVDSVTDLTFRGWVAGNDIAIVKDTKKRYRYISGTTWNEIT